MNYLVLTVSIELYKVDLNLTINHPIQIISAGNDSYSPNSKYSNR